MYYRNGREAKNGDKIVLLEGGKIVAFGILQDAVLDGRSVKGNFLHDEDSRYSTFENECDCLHVDDIEAILVERGLHRLIGEVTSRGGTNNE